MRNLLVVGLAVSVLSASAAFAQTTTPPRASPPVAGKTAPKTTEPAKPRTTESIECSKQADAKGLHGKARKTFRAKCKKDLAKKI